MMHRYLIVQSYTIVDGSAPGKMYFFSKYNPNLAIKTEQFKIFEGIRFKKKKKKIPPGIDVNAPESSMWMLKMLK